MTALARPSPVRGTVTTSRRPAWRPRGMRRRAGALVLIGMAGYVAAVYAVVVLLGSLLLGRPDAPSTVLSIAATAVVALTFEAVRARLGRLAARLLEGDRPAPYDVLRGFTAAVGGSMPAEELPVAMATVLARSTDAEWAQVWLAVRERWTLAAAWPPEAALVPSPPAAGEATAGGAPAGAGTGAVQTFEARHAGELLGLLRVRLRRPMTSVESRLAADLAAQAGLVLKGVQLRSELLTRVVELTARAGELQTSRQRLVAAQDAERRRLERDIHDGAQQHLVALAVNLRLAETLARKAPDRATDLLRAQAEAAQDALDAVRGLSRGVYPSALTGGGLPAALQQVVARSAVPVRLSTEQVARYPAGIEAAVYFSCLEAIQNSGKHSGAQEVQVRLVGTPGSLALTVQDDGRGFDPEHVTAGAGLTNMRDRLDAVGGVLDVHAAPRLGVRIHAEVPVPVAPTAGPGDRGCGRG